jgi:hypothetical protein
MLASLQWLGFTYTEANALRRISMTLRRWFERECGDANGNCIERDETTGKPFCTFGNGPGLRGRYPVADREAGARRRLAAIMESRKRRLVAFVQTDCRGAALYILRKSDVRAQARHSGQSESEVIASGYNRGVAVY